MKSPLSIWYRKTHFRFASPIDSSSSINWFLVFNRFIVSGIRFPSSVSHLSPGWFVICYQSIDWFSWLGFFASPNFSQFPIHRPSSPCLLCCILFWSHHVYFVAWSFFWNDHWPRHHEIFWNFHGENLESSLHPSLGQPRCCSRIPSYWRIRQQFWIMDRCYDHHTWSQKQTWIGRCHHQETRHQRTCFVDEEQPYDYFLDSQFNW